MALARQLVALAQVAGTACRDHVLPSGTSTAAARHDVIEGEILRRPRLPAILAFEAIAQKKTLKRVKAGRRAAGMYSFNAITLGSRIVTLGEWTTVSYSERTDTRSRNTALTASCQAQTESGK